jgi:hypothetical protein
VSAISAIRWLDTNTVRPSPARLLQSVRTQRMPSGSRPFTGSSKSNIPGSPSRAAAIPRRWPIPSELAHSLVGDRAETYDLEYLVDACACNGVTSGQGEQMSTGRATRMDGLRFEEPAHFPQWPGNVVVAPAQDAGESRPMIIRMVVDLPDPLVPGNPVTVPGRTTKDRSSTATTSPKRFERPRASIMAIATLSAKDTTYGRLEPVRIRRPTKRSSSG